MNSVGGLGNPEVRLTVRGKEDTHPTGQMFSFPFLKVNTNVYPALHISPQAIGVMNADQNSSIMSTGTLKRDSDHSEDFRGDSHQAAK